jgi:hypothetical protein
MITSREQEAIAPTRKWIDLRDKRAGAKLRIDRVDPANPARQHLFIIGLSNASEQWRRAIAELGFKASPNMKFLLRAVEAHERIRASDFQKIWPEAVYADVPVSQIGLTLGAQARSTREQVSDQRALNTELANAKSLGRNLEGDSVFETGVGRVIFRHGSGDTISERPGMPSSLFLRATSEQDKALCADGFVKSLLQEVLRAADFDRFCYAIYERDDPSSDQQEEAYELIDAAMIRHLRKQHDTANDAYGDSVRLYEHMPTYRGARRGKAAMPIPLSILTQRLLGDTTDKSVLIPNAFDGATFSFLGKAKVKSYRGGRDLAHRAPQIDNVTWGDSFNPGRDGDADALLFNADASWINADRQDHLQALQTIRSTAPGARVALVLQGTEDEARLDPQTSRLLNTLYERYQVDDAFSVAKVLGKAAGAKVTLHVVSLSNRPPQADATGAFNLAPPSLPVCHNWDVVKARVDEALAKAAILEADADGISVDGVDATDRMQRPYIAFSSIGEASTMVPRDLQYPLQARLSEIEAQYGSVDKLMEAELGYAGTHTLASRFSPEQVDAMAMIIARFKTGRGFILGDETGIGKGRTLAAIASWALKQDRSVVFVTDRANLFSDLARDLRDIGEWGRVRPIITNAGASIVDLIGDDGILAAGTPASEMRRYMDANIPLAETGSNVIFTTYSQLATEGSEKSLWVKNQLKDALLIVDESHIAAGSDSNISGQISEMSSIAWQVVYSSATWAKSPDNQHIYARAFPSTINVASLTSTMRRGGPSFAEIFSSMLAREGALIRREHDLSKLEFRVEIDTQNTERNNKVADKIAEIMSALAYTAGAVKRIVTRMSNLNVAALRAAREANQTAIRSQVFTSRFGAGSMLYQVNRRLNAALNVDNAVRLAIEGIEARRKPVIVFEDTGEAFIRQAIESQQQTLPDGNTVMPEFLQAPTIRDLMVKMTDSLRYVKVADVGIEDIDELDRNRPDDDEQQVAEELDMEDAATEAQGNQVEQQDTSPPVRTARNTTPEQEDQGLVIGEVTTEEPNAQANGTPTPTRKTKRKFTLVPFAQIDSISEEDKRTMQAGLDEIDQLIAQLPTIPLNAPDEMRRRLTEHIVANGIPVRVGELSGRKFQLLHIPGQGYKLTKRSKSKNFVTATVRAFNAGDIDVLLINHSVATGMSVHASSRFIDQRRRQLIEMQIPENPTNRLQLYGRVHRFDQVSTPLIQIPSTGIYGEVRQIMMQNKKLEQLSASVRSSRESHAIVKEVRDMLNPLGEDICRRFLEEQPELLQRLDLAPADLLPNSKRDLASTLTSRIPLLRIDEQKQVYEQLYTMFDDAVTSAELHGENPFKPYELDVRAKVGEPTLLFGVDHQGLGSAFDGAVFAQRLDWVKETRPMSIEAIVEAIRFSRERLVQAGHATEVGRTAAGTARVDLSALAMRAARQIEARARLAIAGTEFLRAEEALASSSPNAVKRGMARAHWLKEHLPKLTPGRMIRMYRGVAHRGNGYWREYRNAVILTVTPPTDRRESQLAQWRVTLAHLGDSAPVTMSLHAVIGRLDVTRLMEEEQDAVHSIDLEIGRDLIEIHDGHPSTENDSKKHWLYEGFVRAGKNTDRTTDKALVLTGNMYLASEWAAATKAGKGVIFTDERGRRIRAILVKQSYRPEQLRYLPTRIWMPQAIERIVHTICTQAVVSDDGANTNGSATKFKFWTTFAEAFAKEHKNSISIVPGHGIVMHVGKGGRARINRMLRNEQKKIKAERYPEGIAARDDSGHVSIGETSKKKAQDAAVPASNRRARGRRLGTQQSADSEDTFGLSARRFSEYVILNASTPEKMGRAIQMLVRGPGLDLYIPNSREYAQVQVMAKQIMYEMFLEKTRADAIDDPARLEKLAEWADKNRPVANGNNAQEQPDLLLLEAEAMLRNVRVDQMELIDFETGEPVALATEEETEDREEVESVTPSE